MTPGAPTALFDAATAKALDGAAVVCVAMPDEAAPFLTATRELAPALRVGRATLSPRLLPRDADADADEAPGIPVLLVESGIGLANAASAVTAALLSCGASLVISAGSAGGLRADVNVGDLIIGDRTTYADADASAFGYLRGQVPGMPVEYPADPALVALAGATVPACLPAVRTLCGQALAGGSFVTAHNVADTRDEFPQALSTDMETTAIAQVASSFGVPFVVLRAISDLCGPAADQDFHLAIDIVAQSSAKAALRVIEAHARAATA